MELFKRALRVLAVFMLTNLGLLEMLCPLPGAVHWPLLLGLLGVYMWFHICPRRAKGCRAAAARHDRRVRASLASFLVLVAEVLFYAALLFAGLPLVPAPYSAPRWVALVANLLFFLPLAGALLINGFFRVALTSRHLRVIWRVLLLFLWWVPFFNIYLFFRVLKTVRSEYFFECARQEAEAVHAENEDCKTRYPIVLVHGIFFPGLAAAWLLGANSGGPAPLRRAALLRRAAVCPAVAQSGEELARRPAARCCVKRARKR